jgi:hypothetical protein
MSLLSIINPTFVRPLLGLSALAVLLILFKPLLVGLLRATLLMLKPRQSLEQRSLRRNMEGVMMMNRMARDIHSSHPSLAAELRSIAARN